MVIRTVFSNAIYHLVIVIIIVPVRSFVQMVVRIVQLHGANAETRFPIPIIWLVRKELFQ